MINEQEIEQSINIADYYYVLLKHKWLIISCFVIIFSLTAFFTYQMKPVYEASSTIVIESERSVSPLTGEKTDYDSYVSQTMTFNTHFKLMTSRPVLEKVIKELKLDQLDMGKGLRVSFIKAFLSKIKKNISLLIGEEEKVLTPEDKRMQLIENLRGNISIKEIRDTRLLKINVSGHDPAIAKEIANGLATAYIEFNASGKLRASRNTLSWMENELYDTKKKLEDAEREFLDYKQNEKIFSIEGKQKLITQKIEDFNTAYLETRNRRLELDSKILKIRQISGKEGDVLKVRSLIDNPLIDNLYAQLFESEVELNRLSSVFKEKHPKIVQIETKIENTRKKLNDELEKEIENLNSQRSILSSKEKVLQSTVSDFENDALEANKKELQYIILQRNVDTHKNLYDTLFSKIKASNIEENLDVSNIRVVEEAIVPLYPVKPNKKMNLMLSAILGLMCGIGISFLWEYLDRTLYTEEDIQKYLNLPVLSVIPEADLP